MNSLIRQFYRTGSQDEPQFSGVVFLSESGLKWDAAKNQADDLPRGWFELCQLPPHDRVEFTRDYWLDWLPFHPRAHPMLSDFFSRLDDIEVVLSRSDEDDPWQTEMVYSLAEDRCFFRGKPPGSEMEIDDLKKALNVEMPRDYLSFLRIHNGFGKLSEWDLLDAEEVKEAKRRLLNQCLRSEKPITCSGRRIDPDSLIPFFESFGLSSFQCFFADWYPGSEMGNVYLSGIDYTISDYMDRKNGTEHLAFPTFLEWLVFYLEGNSLD